MEDNISFIETHKIDDSVQIIMRQTDYTEEIAKEKLKEFNYDHLAVIRSYFGIVEKKAEPVKSVNQEIYKQLRYRLNSNMRNYQERVEKGEAKKI
jgi:hypothetical protein